VNADQQKLAAKHTLLATAANQNYQRCYRALQHLERYWAGTKYILTVLDQKAEGVGEPLLYTNEEMESALEVPQREPTFTSPGWRLVKNLSMTTANAYDILDENYPGVLILVPEDQYHLLKDSPYLCHQS
jgi:hypothetical protein